MAHALRSAAVVLVFAVFAPRRSVIQVCLEAAAPADAWIAAIAPEIVDTYMPGLPAPPGKLGYLDFFMAVLYLMFSRRLKS
jgi:hypothetical protein